MKLKRKDLASTFDSYLESVKSRVKQEALGTDVTFYWDDAITLPRASEDKILKCINTLLDLNWEFED